MASKGTARDAVEHPTIPGQPLTTKKYPAPMSVVTKVRTLV